MGGDGSGGHPPKKWNQARNQEGKKYTQLALEIDIEKMKHPGLYHARILTKRQIQKLYPDGYPMERLVFAKREKRRAGSFAGEQTGHD